MQSMKTDRLLPINERIRTEYFHPTQAKMRSRGSAFIGMMKAADLWQFDHGTPFWRLRLPELRRVFPERQMGSGSLLVARIRAQDSP